jgi:hypothetical protein
MAEIAVNVFIGKDDLVNVNGIIVAGLADLKNELVSPKILDKRIREKVLDLVDVQYGMRKGLTEAINLSAGILGGVKILKDQKVLERFMKEVVSDGLCACGLKQTVKALDECAVDTLIAWDNLPVRRVTLRNDLLDETRVVHFAPKKGRADVSPSVEELLLKSEKKDALLPAASVSHFKIVDDVLFTEWLADHYRESGMKLVLVSNSTEAGSQFEKTFGGIGAILKFKLPFGLDDGEDDADGQDWDQQGEDDDDDFFQDDEEDDDDDDGFGGEEDEAPPGQKGKERDLVGEKVEKGQPVVRPPHEPSASQQQQQQQHQQEGVRGMMSTVKYSERVFVPKTNSNKATEGEAERATSAV